MDISVQRETHGQAKHDWLGSAHGTDAARSITIDVASLTAATHYPNGFIPAGMPLGKITASGLFAHYDNAASDGTQALAGLLLEPVKVASGATKVSGALLEHGRVINSKLPVQIDAAGIADVAGRIIVEA